MDIFAKCPAFTDAKEAMAAGLYPFFIPMEGNEGAEAVCQGRRMIMLGSNNYLGLTMDKRVRQAAEDALRKYGPSCTGSRFANGTLELHLQLERELAEFVDKEAALVFSTGMQTNLGTISALMGRGDYVILDKEDHASIIDGARLSWGLTKRFKHNDMKDFERVLASLPEDKGKLVIVDGLYSMEGDIAPLPEIVPLCKKFGARLMVDDAHATGVLGKGRGTAVHFGMTDEVDLIMSTFSKSFASLGGFIAGDEDVIHYIQHHARALIFSASIPAANAAAALAALHIMRDEPEHCERLNAIAARMRTEYRRMGYDIGNSVSPIIPIVLGDDIRTLLTWKALFEEGVYTNAVVSPAVAPGRQMLRTSYMASHTDEQMDRVLEVFRKVGKKLGIVQ